MNLTGVPASRQESFPETENYECMGMRCYGMSENLNLMENGVPLSIHAYKEAA